MLSTVMESLNIERKLLMPVWDFLPGLLDEHWQESAKNKHIMKLAPDKAKYAKMEAEGLLVSLFAMSGEIIVGYSINIVCPSLHYSELIMAHNDVIYVHPVYRPSSLGLRLIKATEHECSKAGAKLMLMHAKENTPLHKILPRRGYGVQDIILSKELKGN